MRCIRFRSFRNSSFDWFLMQLYDKKWSTGSKVVVNHPLTRPDGTVIPGISRLRRFDWRVGPDGGLCADDYEIWERELREQAEHDRFDGELRSLGVLGDGESIFD